MSLSDSPSNRILNTFRSILGSYRAGRPAPLPHPRPRPAMIELVDPLVLPCFGCFGFSEAFAIMSLTKLLCYKDSKLLITCALAHMDAERTPRNARSCSRGAPRRSVRKRSTSYFADTQAQQQSMIDPPRRPRALPLPTARSSGLCLMERQAVSEDRVETSLDQHDEIRPQRYALLYARGWSHGRRAAADAASCASSPLVLVPWAKCQDL